MITAADAKAITERDCALQMSRAKEKPWIVPTEESGESLDREVAESDGPTLGQAFIDEAQEMTEPGDIRIRPGMAIHVAADGTRQGPTAHYTVSTDGTLQQHVQFLGDRLERGFREMSERIAGIADISINVRDQIRNLTAHLPQAQIEMRTPMQEALLRAPISASRGPIQFDRLDG